MNDLTTLTGGVDITPSRAVELRNLFAKIRKVWKDAKDIQSYVKNLPEMLNDAARTRLTNTVFREPDLLNDLGAFDSASDASGTKTFTCLFRPQDASTLRFLNSLLIKKDCFLIRFLDQNEWRRKWDENLNISLPGVQQLLKDGLRDELKKALREDWDKWNMGGGFSKSYDLNKNFPWDDHKRILQKAKELIEITLDSL